MPSKQQPNLVGTQAPQGYMQKYEWAALQLAAGLRQSQCPRCLLWKFPQEPCHKKGVCPKKEQHGHI